MKKAWLYGLTAEEWLHLAAEGPDSEVAPCCPVISELRTYLNMVCTSQDEEESSVRIARCVLPAYEAALAYHPGLADRERFPLLHKVLEGICAESGDQNDTGGPC